MENIQGEKVQDTAAPDVENVDDDVIIQESESNESDDEYYERVFVDDNNDNNDDSEIDENNEIDDDEFNNENDEIDSEESEKIQEVADLDKSKKQDDEENSKYAAARRESETRMKELEQRQNRFAKQYGYDSFEEMEIAQKAQKYINEGHDEETAIALTERDELKARIVRLEQDGRIKQEKSKLAERTFFKELEPDIDNILKQDPSLSVELIFNALRGERFEKLMEEKSKQVKQKTMTDNNSKNHLKPTAKGTGNIKVPTVDESEYKMYCKLAGNNVSKADYAKWRSEQS